MANEQNLKKFGSEREPSEAGRKGGKASGAARRRKRDMKNAAKLLLNMPVTGENTIKNLETLGFEEEDMIKPDGPHGTSFSKGYADRRRPGG